jgi:PIN domain nuclease of toxin-antitoxin system
MKILLDTQVLLWSVGEMRRLSSTALLYLTDTDVDLFFSMASLWEIAIKVNRGTLRLPKPLHALISEYLVVNAIQILPIETHHILHVEHLPLYHRDPFDRCIIAQSLVESLPVLSADAAFDKYGIQRLW